MTAKPKKKPTPDELLAEVIGQEPARTYEFADYLPAVHEMVKKKFSYAHIAEFLNKRLSISVSRGQVFRAYKIWLASLTAEADEDRGAETFQEEYEQRVDEGARELIDLLERNNDNAPWNDPHSLLRTALEILDREEAEKNAAEKAADEADKALAANKPENATTGK